eukprot:scaffold2430_cov182-Ochromonas_danica.AAC.1
MEKFGYALMDIVSEVSKVVTRLDLPDKALVFLLNQLSNIELRLSHGGNERLQLGALIGAFIVFRDMMSSSTKS